MRVLEDSHRMSGGVSFQMKLRTAIYAATLGLFSVAAIAGWEEYKPGTLAGVIAANPHPPTVNYQTTAGDFPYQVKVQFAGKRRSVSPEKRRVITQWVESLNLESRIPSAFVEEIAFVEAGRTFWLPIQSELIPPLANDVMPGSSVNLYVVWVGSTTREWVFLVNKFEILQKN
jgi:hypothetical protein